MGWQVGQKWPQKIGYYMWMAPYLKFDLGVLKKGR